MKNFEKRRDRFEFFESFENPLLNLSFELPMRDFRPFCKSKGIPPFHFFLFCLFESLNGLDNFKYRIFEGEVIKVDELIGSYTVINENNLFNYTRCKLSHDMDEFIRNSKIARDEAITGDALMNTGKELPLRELKNYVFITSIPWLKFTAIEHPVFKYKSADIPAIAWGKFVSINDKEIMVPMSVQAHHGFVDAFHIHELSEVLKKKIESYLD